MKICISIDILDQIARHCPRALSAYLLCLRMRNSENSCVLTRENLKLDFGESATIFRNSLNDLRREGLVEWYPINNRYHIKLMDLDEEDV